MKRNTVVFDLDGTLLNTLGDLHISFNYAIKNFGYPERSLDEIKSFVGNGITKAIERALPQKVPNDELNQITKVFKEYYQTHITELTKPYDGIIPMLIELKEKDYKISVVSNKFDDAVKKLCKTYFNDLIQITIGEGYGIKKKPDSDGIIKAVKELNSSLSQTIYIGDSDVDILTAKRAQIPCISVLWGFRDKEFLLRSGGRIFAKTPKDIIKIIEKNLYLI